MKKCSKSMYERKICINSWSKGMEKVTEKKVNTRELGRIKKNFF